MDERGIHSGQITCTTCGRVSIAIGASEALCIVERNAERFRSMSEAERESVGWTKVSGVEAMGCPGCGGFEFRPSEPGDAPRGCTLGPALCEDYAVIRQETA